MDITYWIPDYDELDFDFTPPDPEDEIADREKERLFDELCVLIDSGAFDPDNEVPY